MKDQRAFSGALFLDFENVFYAMTNGPTALLRDAAMSAMMEALSALRRQFREENYALVVERGYGDWERLPMTAQRQLQISGVIPCFTDSRVDKNTADIELSLDVLHFMLTRTELEHFVLVGGDRDYLPILRRLKERHRELTVCSFRHTLAGDVREFIANYASARVIELDTLVDVTKYVSTPPEVPATTVVKEVPPPPALPVPGPATAPLAYDPTSSEFEWHERYAAALLRFMREKRYQEIHLGPFFRWLQAERVFDTISSQQQRSIFLDLRTMGAVFVEERDTGQGYAYSVAHLDWNHPMIRKMNQ